MVFLSSVTTWQEKDPLSPTVLNSKLVPLLADILALAQPLSIYSGNQFIASVGTLQTQNFAVGYSSSSTGITLTPLVSVFSGASLVGSFNTLRILGSSSITTAPGEVSITVGSGSGGGQLLTQVAGVTAGSIGTLNFNSGAFRYSVLSSTGSIDFLGMARGQVTIQTAPLSTGSSEVGSVNMGATSFPILVSSIGACWAEIYSSSANQIADASRSSLSDPTTPVVFESVFSQAAGFEIDPKAPWSNVENPSSDSLYYRITQLSGNSGAGTGALASANLLILGSTSDSPLVLYPPSTPGSSGWTAWEYGSVTTRYLIWKTYGGVLGGVGMADNTCARTSVDFSHQSLTVYSDIYRTAVDGIVDTAGFGLFVPNTAISTYTFNNYVQAFFVRSAVNAISPVLQQVTSSGTILSIATGSAFTFAPNTALRFGVHLSNLTLTLYTADSGTGANEVSHVAGAIPSGITGSTHSRVAIFNVRTGAASGFQQENFVLATSATSGTPLACSVTFTRVLGEIV